MDKVEFVEQRLKSQDKSFRIFDEMHILKKDESNNQCKLLEQQLTDLKQR